VIDTAMDYYTQDDEEYDPENDEDWGTVTRPKEGGLPPLLFGQNAVYLIQETRNHLDQKTNRR
jgi:hypothetical protein